MCKPDISNVQPIKLCTCNDIRNKYQPVILFDKKIAHEVTKAGIMALDEIRSIIEDSKTMTIVKLPLKIIDYPTKL